jgi:hypothetical protein
MSEMVGIPQPRSTAAHDAKHHPLSLAHSPSYAVSGQLVYVVCGFDGCRQRLEVDAAVWREEERRRREAGAGAAGGWARKAAGEGEA